jgi:hypothetical protein
MRGRLGTMEQAGVVRRVYHRNARSSRFPEYICQLTVAAQQVRGLLNLRI